MDLNKLRHSLSLASSSSELVKIITAFLNTKDLYYGQGTDNSADESYWIVRSQQNWDDKKWNLKPEIKLINKVLYLVEERVSSNKPLAYILGEAFFAELKFIVNQNVLIPRSPLAELIKNSFSPWLTLSAESKVLEIGTGSACIAIAISKYCSAKLIDASDISEDALLLAKKNIILHGCHNIELVRSNLYSNIFRKYDLIISNPPYVSEESFKRLPKEYHYEPELALKTSEKGLFLVKRILEQSMKYLKDGGSLIIEVGESQLELEQYYHGLPVTWLDFHSGGEGVLIVSKEQLLDYFST